MNRCSNRFLVLTDELTNNLSNNVYLSVIVGFINCLLSQPEDLNDRLRARTQFKSIFKICFTRKNNNY